jgi:two-component system, OmpR family, sensor histidine kinase ChvG
MIGGGAPKTRWHFRAAPGIAARLLAFNLLLVFLPVGAILYLDVYEARLLDGLERGMGQQAGILAAALGQTAAVDQAAATALIARLDPRGDARVRVYDRTGTLVTDSNRIPSSRSAAAASMYPLPAPGIRSRALYRLGAALVQIRRSISAWTLRVIARPSRPTAATDEGSLPFEVRHALQGRYGAATRPTPGQRSLTLNVAVPIRSDSGVVGAVVVSQSTFRVLQALYDVRLRIFEVVIGSLITAMLLTALAAATVVRPIRRLRDETAALAERRRRLPGTFPDANRRDELGELARSLSELTRRLDVYIREADRFAADVAHEFKNPLASIRAAAETVAASDNPYERDRFLSMLVRDVDRLERLVSAVRDETRIEARLDQEPVSDVEVSALLSEVIQGLRLAHGEPPDIRLSGESGCVVQASRDRLAQAFENVLANARSFSPQERTVDVTVRRRESHCSIEVEDQGPGIPSEHLERIFDRFFTYRPDGAATRDRHTGLGLSIARTIIEGYGGTIAAANRDSGGARFEIRLPLNSNRRG